MSYNFQYANEPQACTLAGAHYPTKPNTFTNCDFGIVASAKATRITLDALFNNFDNCITSIFALNVNGTTTANTLNINNNTITKTPLGGIGIRVENLRLVTIANINKNMINQNGFYDPTAYGRSGIDVQNFLSNLVTINVEDNLIRNVRYAIKMRNLTGFQKCGNGAPVFNVKNNIINVTKPILQLNGEDQYGMLLQNTIYAWVHANTVSFAETPDITEVSLLKGISNENSITNTLVENKIINGGAGINMQGDCSGTSLMCNTMETCYNGVYLQDAATVVSPQGTAGASWGNKWFDIYPGNPSARVDGMNVSKVDWSVDGNTTSEFDPCAPGVPCIPNVIVIIPVRNTITSCIAPLMCDNDTIRDDVFEETALNYTVNDPDSAYFRNAADEAFFRVANLDTSILDLNVTNDGIYLSKYLALIQSNIGKYDLVRRNIQSGNYGSAANILAQLTDSTMIEQNKNYVLRVLLANYNYALDDDGDTVSTLEMIAYMHPFYGGQAVYWARAILHIDVVDILPPFRRGKPKNATTTIIENALTYYPNPANNILNIASKNKFTIDSRIIIKNQLGQIVIAHELPFNKIETALNIERLKAGCYFICYFTNSKQVSASKLIIIK